MQSIHTLVEVLSDRRQRGLSLERVYRHLGREDLLIEAHARTVKNDGALTKEVDGEAADRRSLETLQTIGQLLREGNWIGKLVRRNNAPRPGVILFRLGTATNVRRQSGVGQHPSEPPSILDRKTTERWAPGSTTHS